MSLYVLRYGSERGKGDYVGVGTPSRQVDAAKWAGRLAAVRARDESRKRGYDVRIVRLRQKRTLIGYVVRLDGPGEAPKWAAGGTLYGTVRPQERYVYSRVGAESAARFLGGRVVPVYLRVRP